MQVRHCQSKVRHHDGLTCSKLMLVSVRIVVSHHSYDVPLCLPQPQPATCKIPKAATLALMASKGFLLRF